MPLLFLPPPGRGGGRCRPSAVLTWHSTATALFGSSTLGTGTNRACGRPGTSFRALRRAQRLLGSPVYPRVSTTCTATLRASASSMLPCTMDSTYMADRALRACSSTSEGAMDSLAAALSSSGEKDVLSSSALRRRDATLTDCAGREGEAGAGRCEGWVGGGGAG